MRTPPQETPCSVRPGICETDRDQATIFGSPVGNVSSTQKVIQVKSRSLGALESRFQYLHTQDAFCLLRHALTIPKVLYTLRSSPSFLSPALQDFHTHLRSLLGTILNIDLSDSAWTQASLPVRTGGLGVQRATLLAPSAFLASAVGSAHLVHQIIPSRLHNSPYPEVEDALKSWHQGHNDPPLVASDAFRQRNWDTPRVTAVANALLRAAPDETARARLLASQRRETGVPSVQR